MKSNNEQNLEASGEQPEDKKHIYFSMNMPNWFMNKEVNDKCDIVKALYEQLKGAEPITPQQKKELFSI